MPSPCSELIGKTFLMPRRRKFSARRHGLAFNLVDGQKDGLAPAHEHLDQVVIGAGQLSAGVDNKHQRVGLFQRDLGLGVDLHGN